jgi:hypothetical protein
VDHPSRFFWYGDKETGRLFHLPWKVIVVHQVTDRYALHDGRWKIASRVGEALLAPAAG